MSDETNKDNTGKETLAGAFAPQDATPQPSEEQPPPNEQQRSDQEQGQGDPNSKHPALTKPSPEARDRHAQAMQRVERGRMELSFKGTFYHSQGNTRGQLALSYYGGTFYSTWRQVERPQPRQRERRGPER